MSVTTFTFQVELQQNYQTQARQKIVLGRIEYETEEHVLLKFLAWCLFYHPRLAIEKKVEEEFEPDLVIQDYDQTVRLWIECGRVSLHKLGKLTKRYPEARIYVLVPSARDGQMMARQVEKKLDKPERVRIVAFNEDVVGPLLPLMTGKNEVWCNVSWPENVADPVASGTMEMEITMNGGWVHTPLTIIQLAG